MSNPDALIRCRVVAMDASVEPVDRTHAQEFSSHWLVRGQQGNLG
jgi:hypothetical protein